MVSRNDHGEAFFNSLNAVKGILSPLEMGIKKAAKDFECCWSGHANWNKHIDFIPRKNGEVHIVPIGKMNEGFFHDAEVKKKGLLLRIPGEAFAEIVWPHEHSRSKVSMKGSEKKSDVQKEKTCTKCIDLSMTWSVLIAGVFQAFSTPFKVVKKRVQKMSNNDGKYPFFISLEEASTSSSDKKKNVNRYWVVNGIQDDDMKQKDGKHILCLIGLAIEQVTQNFQKSDDCVKVSGKHISGNTSKTQCDHFKIVSNIIKGRKSDVQAFLRNFNFARVGGVPSGMVEEDSVKDENDDSTSAVKEEETTNPASPKQTTRMFDVPLSNVERLRSILSTVSLSELIELVPQLGKSSQDHPDKKKLFSVQDFFRYTESEGRNHKFCYKYLRYFRSTFYL